jgi:hypothetical protein
MMNACDAKNYIHTVTKRKCLICQDDEEDMKILHKTRRQTHSMCLSCLSSYMMDPIEQMIISAKAGNSVDGLIKCTGSYTGLERNRCKQQVNLLSMEFPDNCSLNNKLKVLMILTTVGKVERLRLCPHEDCIGILFLEELFGDEVMCPQCHKTICLSCGAFPYHVDKSCTEYEIEQGRGLSDLVEKGIIKICPTCKNPTEKNGGCNKMHCERCGNTWCWICRQSSIDYDHFKSETGMDCSGLLWEGADINNMGDINMYNDMPPLENVNMGDNDMPDVAQEEALNFLQNRMQNAVQELGILGVDIVVPNIIYRYMNRNGRLVFHDRNGNQVFHDRNGNQVFHDHEEDEFNNYGLGYEEDDYGIDTDEEDEDKYQDYGIDTDEEDEDIYNAHADDY